MGCGGSTLCPAPMRNDPFVALGSSVPVQNACNDLAGSPNAQLCPQNGEWIAVRGDPCSYDSVRNGCRFTCTSGCEAGHCAIAGFGTQCKRTAYLANPLQCCLTGSSSLGASSSFNITCDPKYRGSSMEACQPIIAEYCAKAENFLKPACKTWLRSAAAGLSGRRDEIAVQNCPKNTTGADPFCACYSNPMPESFKGDALKTALFRCLDPACRTPEALQPESLKTCPVSYVNCEMNQAELDVVQSQISAVNLANQCGNVIIDPGTGRALIKGAGGNGSVVFGEIWQTISKNWWILFLVLLIFLGGIYISRGAI